MDKASKDLVFLMDREEVPVETQLRLNEAGLTSLARFASVAKDQEDFRAFLASIGVDPSASLAQRVESTKLTVAWKSAMARTDKRAEAEAEAEVSSHRKALPPTDAQALRSAWKRRWWRLQERQVPSKSLLETARATGVKRSEGPQVRDVDLRRGRR